MRYSLSGKVEYRIWRMIKLEAWKQETTVKSIVEEAIPLYIKFLKKVQMEEMKDRKNNAEMAELKKDFDEANAEVERVIEERKLARQRKKEQMRLNLEKEA